METQSYTSDLDALVVDDEKDICFLLSGILTKKKLHVKCVNTLKEADHTLSEQRPAILFLDNNLPDGYGIDHIGRLKQDHPHLKIIVITSDDTTSDKEKAIEAGADYFIGKPFRSDIINFALDTLLEIHPV